MNDTTTPRKKQALDGTRLNAFGMDPRKMELIGVDTDDGPGHPLWEPGAEALRSQGRKAVEHLIEHILTVGFTRYPLVRKTRRGVEVGVGRDLVFAARFIVEEKLWTRPEPFEVPVVALRVPPTRWRAMIQAEAQPRPAPGALPTAMGDTGATPPSPPKARPVEAADGMLLLPLRSVPSVPSGPASPAPRPYTWPPVPLVPALHDPASVFAFAGHRVWSSDPARARLQLKVRWEGQEYPVNAPLLPLSTTLEELADRWGGLAPGASYVVTLVQLSDRDRVKRGWTSKQWGEADLPVARHPVRPWPLALRSGAGLPPTLAQHLTERSDRAKPVAVAPAAVVPPTLPDPRAPLGQYLARMEAHGLGPSAPETAFADLRQLLALASRHGVAPIVALVEAARGCR